MKHRLRRWLFWKIWSGFRTETAYVDELLAIESWSEHEVKMRKYAAARGEWRGSRP